MNIGETIVVHAWGNFPESQMTCIEVFGNTELNAIGYKFDNGIELMDIELQNNFDLWNSRNGFHIIK